LVSTPEVVQDHDNQVTIDVLALSGDSLKQLLPTFEALQSMLVIIAGSVCRVITSEKSLDSRVVELC
jgi:hypothetical protein